MLVLLFSSKLLYTIRASFKDIYNNKSLCERDTWNGRGINVNYAASNTTQDKIYGMSGAVYYLFCVKPVFRVRCCVF